jgi:hypothetical protein
MTTLHRFHCPTCSTQLTDWLEELTSDELVARQASHTAYVPRGYVISSARDVGHAHAFPVARWMTAPLRRDRVAVHTDLDRTVGCCGLSYRGNLENLVCAQCSTEVATGYEDCCGPHWAAFVPSIGHEVEVHEDNAAPRIAHAVQCLEAVLATSSGLTHPSTIGFSHDLCCDEPMHWEKHAAHASGVSLALDGEQLIVRAASFAEGASFAVAAPRVMLLRILGAPMRPWGEPDLPLVWRVDDARGETLGEVDVCLDARTSRVLLLVTARNETRALLMDLRDWISAWDGLRDQVFRQR